MTIRLLLAAVATAAALFWTATASAACASGATCSCSVSLTSIAFGNYDTQAPSPTDTVGTLSVSCVSSNPGGSTLSIAMSPGSSGNANARTMLAGTHPLYYNLYANVARTMIWGDDSGGGVSVVSAFPPVSRTAKTFSIYGRIPALQNAWVGAYRDSVTVTVTY